MIAILEGEWRHDPVAIYALGLNSEGFAQLLLEGLFNRVDAHN
jgi:hypothetical protein